MIEYLYDAIKGVAGQNIYINAVITDVSGAEIVDDCTFTLHGDNEEIYTVEGEYQEPTQSWQFTIPAEATLGLKGRYWYCIRHENENLCFLKPFYLV